MKHISFRSRGHVMRAGIAAALGIVLSTIPAQSLAGQSRGVGPSNIVSANPFLPLFGYFQGEFEHFLRSSVAVAVAGSHIKFGNEKYTNLDAKVRLYPTERGLEGFNVAVSLGVANIKDDDGSYGDCVFEPEPAPPCPLIYQKFGAGAFAVEMGYQWLLGPSKVMAVSVGGGAKRYIASKEKFQNTEQVVPTVRLTIGYAF